MNDLYRIMRSVFFHWDAQDIVDPERLHCTYKDGDVVEIRVYSADYKDVDTIRPENTADYIMDVMNSNGIFDDVKKALRK